MSEITFRHHFESYELQNIDLPVEVHKSNLALVAKTVTSQSLDVKPGTYHVTARLPSGQELYSQVTVGDTGSHTVDLRLDPEELSPHEHEEVQRYIVGQRFSPGAPGYGLKGLEALGEATAEALLRVFRGNLLDGTLEKLDPAGEIEPLPAPARGIAKFSIWGPPTTVVQLLQPGSPALNILVPFTTANNSLLTLTQGPDGLLTIDVQLHNMQADALLRFYERGLLVQADSLASHISPALLSEELLRGKMSDPIAACVGAYMLLRLGGREIKRLRDWTENLRKWFDWLPDAVAIRGEHLARLGEHQAAQEILVDLPQRGLPYFSDGLSYAVNRLRLYGNLPQDDASFKANTKAVETLAKLRRFASFTDFHSQIVTFTGLDPTKPDAQPLADLRAFDGLSVAAHLG